MGKTDEALRKELESLREHLRSETRMKYGRVNPFCEDLFDWKEKGEFCGSEGTAIYDSATVIGDVTIGKNCWIGPFTMLDGSGKLTIGHHVDISTGVKIYTHDTVKRALTGGKNPTEVAPTSIGNNCFIGTDAVILKGVRIGNMCVIGANSLVNRNFPDRTIIAGAPAKKIGHVEMDRKGAVKLVYGRGKK